MRIKTTTLIVAICELMGAQISMAQQPVPRLDEATSLCLECSTTDFITIRKMLRNIDAAIGDANDRLDKEESFIDENLTTKLLQGGPQELQEKLTEISWAQLRWSAQFSRRSRYQFEKYRLVREIYEKYWPRNVSVLSAGLGNSFDSTPEYVAKWNDPEIVTNWKARINEELDKLSDWEAVFSKLEQDRLSLRAELDSLSAKQAFLIKKYGDQGLDNAVAKIAIESIGSIFAGACSGDIGLYIEAGYQVLESSVYCARALFRVGGVDIGLPPGILKTYERTAPVIADSLNDERKDAAQSLWLEELAIAKARQTDRSLLQLQESIDKNRGLLQVAMQEGQQRWDVSMFNSGRIPHKILSKVGSGAGKLTARLIYDGIKEGPTPITTLLKNRILTPNFGSSAVIQVLTTGLDELVSSQNTLRANNAMTAIAYVEIAWFGLRRQLVAHRMYTESVMALAFEDYERVFGFVSDPGNEVRRARRELKIELNEPLISRKNQSLLVAVQFSGPIKSMPVYTVSGSSRLGRARYSSSPGFVDPVLRRESENDGVRRFEKSSRATDTEINWFYHQSAPDSLNPQRILIYPTSYSVGASSPKDFRWIFDPDPSTPVTFFDLKTYTWSGLDRNRIGDDSYELTFASPVKFELRNESKETTIKNHR